MVGKGYQPVNCFAGPDPPGTAVSLSWPTWLAASSSPSSLWVGVQLPVGAQQVSISGTCCGDRSSQEEVSALGMFTGWHQENDTGNSGGWLSCRPMAECLPAMCDALGLIGTITKNETKP